MKRSIKALCPVALTLLLASCYQNGLLKELAYSGNPAAQYELGRRMLIGVKGMPEAPATAVPWLRLSANGGDNRAMTALGLCYERGLGVELSLDSAREWYKRGARSGNSNACLALVQLETRAGNLPAAARWLEPLAEGGSVDAQLLCGKLCLSGHAGKGKESTAVRYLRFAAMQGNAEACLLMSSCYAAGVGVPKNEGLMLGWLENAAAAGDEKAKKMLEKVNSAGKS